MPAMTIIITLLVASFAVSYGWGMRGCIIGGEKGAMLPGALLGIVLAWFSGVEIFRTNFWIFASVGALTMFFGGTEPYGQTMGFVLHHGAPDYDPKKGYTGLALKGMLWFGLCAAFLGMSFSVVTGAYYEKYELIGLFVTIPFVQALGVKVLNNPYDKEKKIFPRIFFSLDRREEWGGNLFLLLELIIFVIVKKDTFALLMCLSGMLSGAIGWILAIFIYDKTAHRRKNGKFVLGKAQEHGMIDNWKIMEYTLGAVGGFGISLCFCLNYGTILRYGDIVGNNGRLWDVLGEYGDTLSWIAIGLFMAAILQYVYVYYKTRGLKDGLGMDMHVIELIERPLYSVIPLLLIMLGSLNMAQLMSFFAIYWVLMEKMCFEIFDGFKNRIILCGVYIFAGILVFAGEIAFGSYTLWQTWLLYCAVYVASELLRLFRPKRVSEVRKKSNSFGEVCLNFGGALTVDAYFVFEIAVLLIIGGYLFI